MDNIHPIEQFYEGLLKKEGVKVELVGDLSSGNCELKFSIKKATLVARFYEKGEKAVLSFPMLDGLECGIKIIEAMGVGTFMFGLWEPGGGNTTGIEYLPDYVNSYFSALEVLASLGTKIVKRVEQAQAAKKRTDEQALATINKWIQGKK